MAVGLSLLLFTSRSIEFAFAPTIPFGDVVYYFGDRYNRYAEELGAQDASILLPDLGGTLYVSKLRVYDLAGLCDRRPHRADVSPRLRAGLRGTGSNRSRDGQSAPLWTRASVERFARGSTSIR